MPLSQNGWSASSSPAAFGGLYNGVIPGSQAKVAPGVRNGDVALVLFWLASEFHRTVEPLVPGWCWGYAWRSVRGSSATSNHASATGIDLNAPRHPLGKSGTFSNAQEHRIKELLSFLEGAVRWGGNYSGRKDEMHFEIHTSEAGLRHAANKIRATGFTLVGGGGSPAPAGPPRNEPAPPVANATLARVQGDLHFLGYDAGAVDGLDGPKTQSALKAFQTAAGIDPDGIYGPNTQGKMTLVGVNGPFPGVTRLGMRNSPVTGRYQQRLKDRGWKIAVDNDHGLGTDAVMKSFQREKGLTPDGDGGAMTWTALWTRNV